MTSIVVTHDMKSAFDVGDRIAYLKHGRIEFEGTAAELQAAADPDIQDFIAGRSRPLAGAVGGETGVTEGESPRENGSRSQ